MQLYCYDINPNTPGLIGLLGYLEMMTANKMNQIKIIDI